ncbi:hypothetical protein KQX54_007335 [Cotesia glomerata]|uniref:Uncharacterized protein n=1 Tax=Cotesia glomerata TaxID=32391 RepID=A0AAV7I7S0_COTGL|nr:hypothetical protein KQX54_007335 [Cotesia glomerata]
MQTRGFMGLVESKGEGEWKYLGIEEEGLRWANENQTADEIGGVTCKLWQTQQIENPWQTRLANIERTDAWIDAHHIVCMRVRVNLPGKIATEKLFRLKLSS